MFQNHTSVIIWIPPPPPPLGRLLNMWTTPYYILILSMSISNLTLYGLKIFLTENWVWMSTLNLVVHTLSTYVYIKVSSFTLIVRGTSYHATRHDIYHATWHHTTRHDVIPRDMTSYHATWNHETWRHTTRHDIIPRDMTSYHATWHHTTRHDVIPRDMTSYHATWHHTTRHDVIPRDMTSYHATWNHETEMIHIIMSVNDSNIILHIIF